MLCVDRENHREDEKGPVDLVEECLGKAVGEKVRFVETVLPIFWATRVFLFSLSV